MTAPTEAEVRAYFESDMADWSIAGEPRILSDLTNQFDAFEKLIANEHITDDDFGAFTHACDVALDASVPALTEALRPILLEVQVRGAMRFFEHFPEAPLAKQPVSAR